MQGGPDPYCRGTFPWDGGDLDLENAIKEILWQRRKSQALQTGHLTVEAPDENTLLITREIRDDVDVFGHPAKNETVTVTIQRV